jgi:L-lactate dehydrogenase complex protein LldE
MGKVGLFIPCYVDQFYPRVGLSTLRILRGLGLDVEYPRDQTCCGQPQFNTGCSREARPLAERFVRLFSGYEAVVAPSGSCVSMVRLHYPELLDGSAEARAVGERTFELTEYLVDVAKVTRVDGEYRKKVGLHRSCHGIRELRMSRSSERMDPPFDKTRQLVSQLRGIELVELSRPDECCGFGGTFAVTEEAVSRMMGRDRLADHVKAGAEVIAGYDMSCLMHLEGIARRDGVKVPVVHVAEMLENARLSR